MSPTADGEPRRHRILHLSDPHVTAGGFDEDGVNATAALERILHDVRFVAGIDLVLVTGDIADDGSAAGCTAVQERVGRFAAERGVPHVYTTGNHDRLGPFTAALGSGHFTADGQDVGQVLAGAAGERAAVSEVAGLRVITLDSLVAGSVHGVVSRAQLDWLGTLLAEPAPAGSIVALHHPPIALESPDVSSVVLQNPQELGQVIAGTDVRAVLTGHLHFQAGGFLAGVPVWVTPGIVTRIDLTAPPHLLRAVKGAGASVVDLGGPSSPMFHTLYARDPAAGEQVYLVEAGFGAAVDTEEPEPTG